LENSLEKISQDDTAFKLATENHDILLKEKEQAAAEKVAAAKVRLH
jgi:hypothetical protein